MIKVLIVEDDKGISILHKKFVERVEGFEVTAIANTVSDAKQMIGLLKPDLVLLDIYLPDGSGIDFIKSMRDESYVFDVIVITAARDVNTLRQAMQKGVFDYIIKPVIIDRFNEALEKYRSFVNIYKKNIVNQEDIDKVKDYHSVSLDNSLPKGIDKITLDKIIKCFVHDRVKFTAEEVGNIIGFSRNTARRYLDYLQKEGVLGIDIDYGTVGRPEKKYYLVSKKF